MMTIIGFDNSSRIYFGEANAAGITKLILDGCTSIFMGNSKDIHETFMRHCNRENIGISETIENIRKECNKFEKVY